MLVLLAVVVVGGAALACGGGGSGEDAAEDLVEQAIKESGGGDVDIEVDNAKLPDNFPKEFPIYEGAKVTFTLTSSAGSGQSGNAWTVSWETKDSVEKVTKFYQDNLSKNQWTISATSTDSSGASFFIDRDAGGKSVGGMVTITRDGDVTAITAILGEDSN
ncbi:MAG TPA: hypothetical protein VIO14_04500 [Dehalococcoidia bacterium]